MNSKFSMHSYRFPQLIQCIVFLTFAFQSIYAEGAWGRKNKTGFTEINTYTLDHNEFYTSEKTKITKTNYKKNILNFYTEHGLPKSLVISAMFPIAFVQLADSIRERGFGDFELGFTRSFATPIVSTGLGLTLSMPSGQHRSGDSLSLGDGEWDFRVSMYMAREIRKIKVAGELYHRQHFAGYTPVYGYNTKISYPIHRYLELGITAHGQNSWGSLNPRKVLPYTELGEGVIYDKQGFSISVPVMDGSHFTVGYENYWLGNAENVMASGVVLLSMGMSY